MTARACWFFSAKSRNRTLADLCVGLICEVWKRVLSSGHEREGSRRSGYSDAGKSCAREQLREFTGSALPARSRTPHCGVPQRRQQRPFPVLIPHDFVQPESPTGIQSVMSFSAYAAADIVAKAMQKTSDEDAIPGRYAPREDKGIQVHEFHLAKRWLLFDGVPDIAHGVRKIGQDHTAILILQHAGYGECSGATCDIDNAPRPRELASPYGR